MFAHDEIRQAVRETYGEIAQAGTTGCGCSCGCGDAGNALSAEDVSVGLGYSTEEVSTVPEGANMGLGCGNPQAIAALQPGETVIDLGSGGGDALIDVVNFEYQEVNVALILRTNSSYEVGGLMDEIRRYQ